MIETIDRLSSLPAMRQIAVIINCGTRWVTTLALASLQAASERPVLIIDCESRDGSRAHFEAVSREHALSFHWLDWPLRKHGAALDRLFDAIPADEVLLVDSDAEIRNPAVLDALDAALAADPDAYGSGFLHGPDWLGAPHGLPAHVGWYAPRMWIPLVLLRTAAIRAARERGASFEQRRAFVEWPGHPLMSRALGARFWLPGLRTLGARRRSAASDPAFVEFDTGAAMHAALERSGHRLARVDDALWHDVGHYHGVSRAGRGLDLRKLAARFGIAPARNDTPERAIMSDVRKRLADRYGISRDPLEKDGDRGTTMPEEKPS